MMVKRWKLLIILQKTPTYVFNRVLNTLCKYYRSEGRDDTHRLFRSKSLISGPYFGGFLLGLLNVFTNKIEIDFNQYILTE